jgi:preprotein translocase subunit SecA
LRGRSGRQGDPGSSQFFLSLEDDLLRIFEADRVAQWWDRVGVEEGEAIENKMLSKVIENAQKKVESRNFDIRKHLLDYDDVMNKQRKAFYARRLSVLTADNLDNEVEEIVEGIVVAALDTHWPEKGAPEPEHYDNLVAAFETHFGIVLPNDRAPMSSSESGEPAADRDQFGLEALAILFEHLEAKKVECAEMAEAHADIGYPNFSRFQRDIMLQVLDAQWKDHLHSMDGLREGIGLRGYAQKDPKVEYQREGFALFGETEERMDEQSAEIMFRFSLPIPRPMPAQRGTGGGPAGEPQRPGAALAAGKKVGRNDPCPCGSGKKFKKCCGS